MTTDKPLERKAMIKDLIVAFLVPTLIGKSFVLYFGLNYSNNPGEGYGYGLVASILFTLTMVGRFIWKYRNYEDL
jgi:hypothetical protein